MYLAEKLSGEFGKGYDESNLRKMRKFYIVFPRGCRKIKAMAPNLLQKKMGPEGPIYC